MGWYVVPIERQTLCKVSEKRLGNVWVKLAALFLCAPFYWVTLHKVHRSLLRATLISFESASLLACAVRMSLTTAYTNWACLGFTVGIVINELCNVLLHTFLVFLCVCLDSLRLRRAHKILMLAAGLILSVGVALNTSLADYETWPVEVARP